ncbi:MAG TPA: MotA/TolQ/ExbB proton channel family protein [Planctomycetota bacterium]|nr:MotA/TolQ/ExbB proton channel family protein [Planctomycetota bacterium]
MNRVAAALAVVVLAAGAVGAQSEALAGREQTVGRLSQSAEQQLARSIEELNTLRESIAKEKLPLAQELTAQEEKLAQLRKDHEEVTRLVDAGNLEISTIKVEIKARQDELSYTGNLLDEYARSFESKVNISELQSLGAAIDTAKQATENPALSMTEKYGHQLDFVHVTLERLSQAIGGMRFPGVGVDQAGLVADGQFAIIGPVALFRAASGVAGLVVPQSGSTRPLIRPLEGPMQVGLASLVESGTGTMPLDPSRGGALKALVQKTNLIHIFEKGGPIMWPLLLSSILALGTVLERVFFLLNEARKRSWKTQDALFQLVQQGDVDGAIELSKKSKDFVVRTLGYALEHKEQSLANALLYAQARELKRFQRGTSVLDTVITLAPLLGLLGTVTGMMGSFSLIGGDLSAPGAITGGIAEALIATAFGLGIAITSLIPFNWLNTKLEVARHELESASAQLELMIQKRGSLAGAVRSTTSNYPVRDASQLLVAAGQE